MLLEHESSADQSSSHGLNNSDNFGTSQTGLQQGSQDNSAPRRSGRGFASMDPQRVSQIASMGGKAAHEQGVAHEWTPDEARAAGRKGGQASHGGARNSRAGDNLTGNGPTNS